MEYQKFIPEGWINTNEKINIDTLKKALQSGEVMQGLVSKCDSNCNLHINFDNNIRGIIPREEIELVQDIRESILRNKENSFVQFKVMDIKDSKIILSRKAVKEDALKWVKDELQPGSIVSGIVKNIRPFGAFVEIGGGVVGLLHIEDISISRIKSPEERFYIGQKINVMIKLIEDDGKIVLSYKELLGNWEENVKELEEKTIVDGIVKEADKYKNGIFIELKPNLVGMAEYKEGLVYGQKVKVIIKKIIRSKKKIKVVIV